jgi:prolyl-tRNA editing enzyme YbaK/EbsC (Cys-tRNA(Pro) deacylase)
VEWIKKRENPLADYRLLLKPDESVPDAVRECYDSAIAIGLAFIPSRNAHATTCADAAAKRTRDGVVGIPLHDELKTFLGVCHGLGGATLFMAHCRGNQRLDWRKIERHLASPRIERLTEDQLEQWGTGFGRINPFLYRSIPLIQLFDCSLQHGGCERRSVMTNASEWTWAIEFDPEEAVLLLPDTKWADITRI